MGIYIDLHMHSAYSDDGEYTPVELVTMCGQAGIRIMAVTDHNCARANVDAQREAERLNIKYLPGVELECTWQDMVFHLLGYQIDYKSSDFEKIESNIREQSLEASRERLRLIRKLGFHVTEDELYAVSGKRYWKDYWSGEIFAEILLNKPEYMDNEILRHYRPGGSKGDNPYVNIYWDYFAQGKPCYAEMIFPGLKEAIEIIKDNGGKSVLAHPGNNLKNRFALLDEMITLGLDGVEVFSSYHDRSDAEHFYKEARKHSLMITCGSDFHGKTKPSIRLGESGCFIEESEIERQLPHFQDKRMK